MKLGKLFKAVIKLPIIPAAIIADVASLGVFKVEDKKFLTEKIVDSIEKDLDKITE